MLHAPRNYLKEQCYLNPLLLPLLQYYPNRQAPHSILHFASPAQRLLFLYSLLPKIPPDLQLHLFDVPFPYSPHLPHLLLTKVLILLKHYFQMYLPYRFPTHSLQYLFQMSFYRFLFLLLLHKHDSPETALMKLP